MDIEQLAKKYDLSQEDFWKHGKSGKWIIKHDGVEKIASMDGIIFEDPNFIITERDCCVLHGTASLPLGGNKFKTEWTIGEADMKFNCKMGYPYAIAEKRLKDRLTLKLINAYEYGIYSDSEADGFSKGKNPTKVQLAKLETLAHKLGKSINSEGMDRKAVSMLIDELITEEAIFDAKTKSEQYAQAKGE